MRFATEILDLHYKMVRRDERAYENLETTRKRDSSLRGLTKEEFYTVMFIHCALDDKRPVYKILKDVGKQNAHLVRNILQTRVSKRPIFNFGKPFKALLLSLNQPDDTYVKHLHAQCPERWYFNSPCESDCASA